MEEEKQEMKQESDDVSESSSHKASEHESVLRNPDGREDMLPERTPAAEVPQHQPDQAADLKKPHQCHTCGKWLKTAELQPEKVSQDPHWRESVQLRGLQKIFFLT